MLAPKILSDLKLVGSNRNPIEPAGAGGEKTGQNVPQTTPTPAAVEAASQPGPPVAQPAQMGANASDVEYCAWIASGITHADSLRGVCQFAMSLPRRMPNFICEQETSRFEGGRSKPFDVVTSVLRYENQSESYSEVKLNGRAVPQALVVELAGLWSTGDFGANLRSIFDPTNEPVFRFDGAKSTARRAAWGFTFSIKEQKEPRWWITADADRIAPPYGGELLVDAQSGDLLEFRLAASELPRHFATQRAETEINYARIPFDDGSTFSLPIEVAVSTKFHGNLTRNITQFRSCHKFQAKSRMLLDVPSATKRR